MGSDGGQLTLGPLDTVVDATEHFFHVLGAGNDASDSSYHAGSSVTFSWYISPRQHAVEFLLVNAAVIPVLFWLSTFKRRVVPGMTAVSTGSYSWPVALLDWAVHATGLVTLVFTLWYKQQKDAFIFMLQP